MPRRPKPPFYRAISGEAPHAKKQGAAPQTRDGPL